MTSKEEGEGFRGKQKFREDVVADFNGNYAQQPFDCFLLLKSMA